MSLLQMYPLETAGGVDSVLQTAVELRRRREEELKTEKTSGALGSRLRDTIWRGFTNQGSSLPSSPDISDSSEEELKSRNEGDETETPHVDATSLAPTFTSRLANVVWQGITNQSAMDVPPSPISPTPSTPASPLPPSTPASPLPPSSPVSPAPHSPASPLPTVSPQSPVSESSPATSSLWSYAEKIRDSDTAASLAKASTNWKVRAMQAWNSRKSASPSPNNPSSPISSRENELGSTSPARRSGESIPDTFRTEVYSPPARPAYFRPPRDSMLPQPRRGLLSSPTSPESGDETASAKLNIKDSIASLAGLVTASPSKPSPKSGPKPLLLNSSSLLTRSAPSPPVRSPPTRLRADSSSSAGFPAYVTARPIRSRDSQSEWESDATGSRIVPLNRRSVSPMAPQSRTGHGRLYSSSSDKGVARQDLFLNGEVYSPSGRSEGSASRGWGRIDTVDSPATLPPSPPLHTPPSAALNSSAVSDGVYQRDLAIAPEPGIRVLEAPNPGRKLVRKKTPPPLPDYTSDSSVVLEAPPRSPRLRSKRSPHHLSKLQLQRPGPVEVSTGANRLALPELSDDHDTVITPRATAFREGNEEKSASSASPISPAAGPHRAKKLSSDGRKASGDTFEPRTRKISSSGHSPRTRKVSESRSAKQTESAAEEGDDEGYDELLNAYESEDSTTQHYIVQ
jgi:hypothetical protein